LRMCPPSFLSRPRAEVNCSATVRSATADGICNALYIAGPAISCRSYQYTNKQFITAKRTSHRLQTSSNAKASSEVYGSYFGPSTRNVKM
jgi:hypothetical protein